MMIPFSLLWVGFVAFWEFNVLRSGVLPFALFGAVFIVFGLYFVIGRYLHAAWLASRTLYAVTNRRVIMIAPNRTRTLPIKRLPRLEKRTKRNGLGTISFEKDVAPVSGFRVLWPGQLAAFENIADVDDVYDLISAQTMDNR